MEAVAVAYLQLLSTLCFTPARREIGAIADNVVCTFWNRFKLLNKNDIYIFFYLFNQAYIWAIAKYKKRVVRALLCVFTEFWGSDGEVAVS